MDRREMFGALGVAAGVAALGMAQSPTFAADEPKKKAGRDKTHEECLKACSDCAIACNETMTHCMEMLCQGEGNLKNHAKAHSLALDCAAFCTLSATMIARNSLLMAESCDACASACEACAAECQQSETAQMRACADACLACQKSCEAMVDQMKSANKAASK